MEKEAFFEEFESKMHDLFIDGTCAYRQGSEANSNLNMKFQISTEYASNNPPAVLPDNVSISSSQFPNFKNEDAFSRLNEPHTKTTSEIDFLNSDIFKTPKENKESKKEKNRIKARETRKRKKNYVSELEDKVATLEIENKRLHDQIALLQNRLSANELGEENKSLLSRLRDQDQKYHENLKEGKGLCEYPDPPEESVIESGIIDPRSTSEDNKLHIIFGCNQPRIHFLDKVFDIIIDNLLCEKYRFKFLHCQSRRPSFDELKKLQKASKYQVQELLKEKRITEYDILNAKMDLNKKQYNYFVHNANDKFFELRNSLIEAVAKINEARNTCTYVLSELDAMHHMIKETDLIPASQTSEAGKYIEEKKLGLDIKPQKLFSYKKVKKILEFCYDPKVVTSLHPEEPTTAPPEVTYRTEVFYNQPAC
ncbi:unnamed protein product [Moneuplotes crassus]|uniref:BZIP domain-containing protein n=2 Tax=Euplotes crassus TaxID=5936 RepID=A0AAD1XEF6_EUPCR|nr:unnamed protein product [Moneuplotes crassus]